ncbi:wiskott-Aldrich syndrome protein homolog [Cajanus cajan]|uniref:wiskott-Aldrich syndrome protein homolog n=1 Tax=Cajanus cajan TaxID=3821 RepID=UPI00098DA039|nr:wiskott-Aldrich syndrome protein homolog [Cajanus cajan]
MESEPRSIKVKLISCKDVRSFNFFQKLTLYATVFVESEDPKRDLTEEQKQRQRTLTHRDGDGDGSNPEWNHHARFHLAWLPRDSAVDDLFLRFEFRHDGLILGDKLIGECRVALADLIRDADAAERFVSYEVRSAEGKPNGIFNFSYKVKGLGLGPGPGPGPGIGIGNLSSQILEGRISGYPILAPEDCAPVQSHVQYPTCEIQNTCSYPTVAVPVGSAVYPAAAPPPPPDVMSSPGGGYDCYYPPPPPPPHVAYPYPPPPPPVVHAYPPPFGPQAHHWPPGPCCDRRW